MKRNALDKSSLLFSNRFLATLIIPLLIETLLNVTIGMMDTIMVSTNGEAAVSGVSLVDSLANLFIFLFSAFATGGAVVASQYLGRKDKENASESAKQLLYISFLFSLLISVVVLLFNEQLMSLVFGKIEEDVESFALSYLTPIALSFPFLAITNSANAVCRSVGKSKITMTVSLVMNIINVSGNAILIYIFGMGPLGAGIASLLSRITACAIMLSVVCGKNFELRVKKLLKVELRFSMIFRILRIALPSGIENCIFHIGKILVTSTISTFGTASIAAYAVFNSLATFANIPGSAIGMAAVTVIGQCCGAGNYDQAKYYARKLITLTFILQGLTCLLMFVLTPNLASLYNLSAVAYKLSVDTVRICLIQTFIFWPLAFTVPNFLRASGDVKFTMLVSIISMWLFRVMLARVLGITFSMGLEGVCWAMYIDWYCRGAFFVTRWLKGKWKEKTVI
ncbi:MAG TPA: MATE family efflux transporter [Candidatus Ornithospirochaeta avicola]|uniref:Multidrug-efflux transporter n=1 Tax=Candidatus Ornithospirochaeta avicola TaxID=2840896 RepID=A0A9D1TNE4_9SPIO|nr:MATE family efflux transporter [Candidatus Ornithospirochaeta avicola]